MRRRVLASVEGKGQEELLRTGGLQGQAILPRGYFCSGSLNGANAWRELPTPTSWVGGAFWSLLGWLASWWL